MIIDISFKSFKEFLNLKIVLNNSLNLQDVRDSYY